MTDTSDTSDPSELADAHPDDEASFEDPDAEPEAKPDRFRSAVEWVAVNRAAFDDPSILAGLADEFGSQAVVCAIDAKAGEVFTHAGTRPTFTRSEHNVHL